MEKERRKFVRYSTNIPSCINTSEINGSVKDISSGGVSIQTAIDFEQETTLYFVFLLEEESLNCEGKIRVKIKKEKDFKYGIAFYQQFHETGLKLIDALDKIKSVEIGS